MVNILVIKKSGSIKVTDYTEESVNQLYKVAGFKTKQDFSHVTEWTMENDKNKTYDYCVYAKNNGNAGNENKYDFPPPIDNELYFGSCVIVKRKITR